MAIRIGQLARAHVIGRSVAPQGGYFIILVFYIQNLGTGDLTVDPVHLALVDSLGQSHRRTEANLAYPMVRFRPQAIQPGYGTSGYEIFTIPPGASREAPRNGSFVDWTWLARQPAVRETTYLRQVTPSEPLVAYLDGRHSLGLIAWCEEGERTCEIDDS